MLKLFATLIAAVLSGDAPDAPAPDSREAAIAKAEADAKAQANLFVPQPDADPKFINLNRPWKPHEIEEISQARSRRAAMERKLMREAMVKIDKQYPGTSVSALLPSTLTPRTETKKQESVTQKPPADVPYNPAMIGSNGGTVYVHSYYRKDGTYVHAYTRRR